MKFLSVLAALVATASASGVERKLDVATYYDIDTPMITWDGSVFSYSITHGRGDGTAGSPFLMVYGRTTGPTNTWPDYACPTFFNDGSLTDEGVAGTQAYFDNVGASPDLEDGGAGGTSTWDFSINNLISASTTVFDSTHPNDPDNALVGFCIYFGLLDTSEAVIPTLYNPAAFQIVSFREIGVELDITLDGELNVVSFQTEAIDPSYSINNVAYYGVTAYLCVGVPQPLDQITPVEICICPDDMDDTQVVAVNHLQFDFGAMTQIAVLAGVEQSTTDPVSSFNSGDCKKVVTMLNRFFFPTAFAEQTVTASGDVDLDLGPSRRKLSSGRKLNEQAKGKFENVGIAVQGPDSESSAVSAGIAGAAALAGAALML